MQHKDIPMAGNLSLDQLNGIAGFIGAALVDSCLLYTSDAADE